MALAFLNLKGFHPSNKANQRRLFIAEEQEKDRIKRDAEAMREWEAEKELMQQKETITQNNTEHSIESVEKLKQRKQQLLTQQNFVNGERLNTTNTANTTKPITVVKTEEPEDDSSSSKKRKRRRRGTGQKQEQKSHPLGVAGALEMAGKLAEERVQQELTEMERKSMIRGGGDKSLNFMYVIPPGLKAAMEREKEEEERNKQLELLALDRQQEIAEQMQLIPEQQDQSFFPRAVKLHETTTPIAVLDPESKQKPKHMIPDAEKFPILKNAPVAGRYTENVKLRHKPLGIELRDVRCTRCGAFGHTNLDRECPMRHFNPLDAKRQQMEDPMAQFVQSTAQPTEEEQNPEDVLNQLTKKERKKLLKKYKELKKKLNMNDDSSDDEKKRKKREKKREREEDDSDSEERRRKRKERRREREEEEEKRNSKRDDDKYSRHDDDRRSNRRDEEDRYDDRRSRRDDRRRDDDDDRRSSKYDDDRRRYRDDDRYDDKYNRRDDRRSSKYDDRR